MTWLYVHAGLGDPSGAWYLWWSGAGSILVVWAASAVLVWWHRSCKAEWWCLLIGRHDYADDKGVVHKLCWRHHPALHGKHLGRGRIAVIEAARQRPGRVEYR